MGVRAAMSVCSTVATLLALSTTVLEMLHTHCEPSEDIVYCKRVLSLPPATGQSKYTQYAFRFENSQICQTCTVDDMICFGGILDCVQISFYTHNVSLVKYFCNTDHMWMLLVLELQTVGRIDNSQYLDGCVGNMSYWKYWHYAECTMDIAGADDYRNCSVRSQPSIANPVLHLPTWVSGVVAVLASLLVLVIIILLTIICAFCYRKRACIYPQGEGNGEGRPLLDKNRAPPPGASSEGNIQDRDEIGDSATQFRLFNRQWLRERSWLPQNWFKPTARSSAVKDQS